MLSHYLMKKKSIKKILTKNRRKTSQFKVIIIGNDNYK